MDENFRKEVLGIKQIALEQYRRCLILGSQNILNDPKQREEYINAVSVMEITIIPEILGSKFEDIKKKFEDNEKAIEELEGDYKVRLEQLKETAKGLPIRNDLLLDHYERKLVKLIHIKLVNVGLMLKKKNYYDEEMWVDT